MNEREVKAEMRLFALESVFCQIAATIFQQMPRAIFDGAKRQAIEGAQKQTFAGGDAAESDLLSAELQIALERLYDLIEHHLDSVQKSRRK
jgi:hypothetical protein